MTMNYTVSDWYRINWHFCYQKVTQMQQQIVVAWKAKHFEKVSTLQLDLVNSFSARAIAVRTVAVVNKGKKTAGVDKIAALTPKERIQLVNHLIIHRDIEAKPVRRVWISKDGKPIKADKSNARPLGIPCM
uniref:Hypothetical reverse transcriptase n=1 Tax=Ourococcus multisporus TaxID=132186 RepID=A0A076VI66_9CHLO|nr:hypothetical reverse transcriptase [Ourococcus multisporus]AIK29179.1 hypothetical reverse transcriptase [Ourococcus multisporus]